MKANREVVLRCALVAALVSANAVLVTNQVALAQGGAPAQPAGQPGTSPNELVIYGDALAEGWENWSWDTQVNAANAQPALGRRSIAVTYKKAFGGFSLRAPTPIDTGRYSGIAFWVHGGRSGKRDLTFYVQQSDTGGESRKVQIEAPAGVWTPITISLSSLDNPKTIARLNIQDNSGKQQPVFYVDNVRLVSGPLKDALSVPLTGATKEGDFVVYSDALAEGWENWSWDSQVNFTNAQPALDRRSIAVTYKKAFGGFSVRAPTPIDAGRYSGIAFWVHGGSSGKRDLTFYIQQSDSGGESRKVQIEAPAGVWTPITISLSSLDNPKTIKRLNIQDNSGKQQPTFYVDNVRLVSGPLKDALSVPFTGPTKEGGYVVYSDVLADGWENWSWGSQVDFTNREPVFAGQRSIAVQMPKGGGGLSLRAPITLSGEAYSAIQLRLRAAKPEARQMQIYLHSADASGNEGPAFVFELAGSEWITLNVPLSKLGNLKTIKRINVQDLGGNTPLTFYVDEIEFLPRK
jgi:hypothetical protein